MVKAKKFVLVKHFDGVPKATDVKLVEEELPLLKNKEYLAEALYFSLDPYILGYSAVLSPGATIIGSQVAQVIESKNPKYPKGSYVVGEFGWRTHTIADDTPNPLGFQDPWIIPEPEELPLSLSLGVLGTTGNTAYFGFLEICKPQPGETVVVSGAAGAVGNVVGQIAKIKGCKVIGIAGSDEKGKWLVNDLKFDHFVNYKDKDFDKKLEEATPNGVDCYFDNVGGDISEKMFKRMNMFGRISICGIISQLGGKSVKVDPVQPDLLRKQLKMEGFMVNRFRDRWSEGILQNKQWIKEGKLKNRETVTVGFENLLEALVGMMQGRNIGKAIVKI